MIQFLNFAFSSPNIVATFILSFCVLYWIIVMIGAIDMDMFDFDIEMDVDADADVETDMSGNSESGVAWFNKVLYFFNLGRFPFMIWLTIVGLIAWFGTVTINFFFGFESFFLGTLIFLAAFIGGVIIAKPLTFPLVKMFDALEKTEGLKNAIGKMGEVVYPDKDGKPGEVEIVHDGSHIKIFALPSSKEISLKKRQKVLVIAKSESDDHIYIVEPYN